MKSIPAKQRLYPHDVLALFKEPDIFVPQPDGSLKPFRLADHLTPNTFANLDRFRALLRDAVAFDFYTVAPTQDDFDYAVEAIEQGSFMLPFPVIGLTNIRRLDDDGTPLQYPHHTFTVWTQMRAAARPTAFIFQTLGDNFQTFTVLPEAMVTTDGLPEKCHVHLCVRGEDKTILMNAAAQSTRFGLACFAKLRLKSTVKTFTAAPAIPNRNRAKRGQPLIAARYTITINLDAPEHNAPQGGTHASPVPHWRRAHTRTLASGLVVPVRMSRIGFDEDPRWDIACKNYEVRPALQAAE